MSFQSTLLATFVPKMSPIDVEKIPASNKNAAKLKIDMISAKKSKNLFVIS